TSGKTTTMTVEMSYQSHEPTSDRIPKIIVFMTKKNVLESALDMIRDLLISHFKYFTTLTHFTVKLYHVSLMKYDKISLYEEFCKINSQIQMLITSDVMMHGTDVSDIEVSIQYGMFVELSINML
ncbi:hypothetical protein LOZ54_006541, partial [Ophidiomyces ophidiicola]